MQHPANSNHHTSNDNGQPVVQLPPAVKWLALSNLAVFIVTQYLADFLPEGLLRALAFVPARVTEEPLAFSTFYPFVTYMFLHSGWLHIGLNMGMLLAFGTGLERLLGAKRMLALYFACGIAAAFGHLAVYPHSAEAMGGASGAISGLFGGVMMLMYKVEGPGGLRMLLTASAVWIGSAAAVGIYGMPGVEENIAWVAHIGGFIAGLLFVRPLAKKKFGW